MVNSTLDYFLHSFISIYGCHYCGFQPWIGESRSFVTATTTASLCRQRNAAKRNITVCYCVIDPSVSFWISIFAHLRRCSCCLLLCLFLGSWLVNKYKQMDCLTQQSIRTVRGQLCVSTPTSIMWNPIKWRAFRATYGPCHVNNAMSSEIGAWLTSDWIVVDGPVDAQQGRSVMDTKQSLFLRP